MKSSNWNANNQHYWNEIAQSYEGIYVDSWSVMENEFILSKMKFLCSISKPVIVDLGCGTGLGYAFCSAVNPESAYIGTDISKEMLNIFKERFPNVELYNSPMSNLSFMNNKKADAVISIFTSFSYEHEVGKSISEISRILKQDGKIFISVLSRFSLRRILYFKFSKQEKYKTRNFKSGSFSDAWVFTKRDLLNLFESDYTDIRIIGYNAFGGIHFLSRYNFLWKASLLISKIFPDVSHELIITATKK